MVPSAVLLTSNGINIMSTNQKYNDFAFIEELGSLTIKFLANKWRILNKSRWKRCSYGIYGLKFGVQGILMEGFPTTVKKVKGITTIYGRPWNRRTLYWVHIMKYFSRGNITIPLKSQCILKNEEARLNRSIKYNHPLHICKISKRKALTDFSAILLTSWVNASYLWTSYKV